MPIVDRLMHVKNAGPQDIGDQKGQVFLCHAGVAHRLKAGDVASWPESVVEHAYKLEYCQRYLERLPEEEGAVVYHETMLRIAKENQAKAQDALIAQNRATQSANETLEKAQLLREKALQDAELIGKEHPRGEDDPFDPEKGIELTPPKKLPPPPPEFVPPPAPLGRPIVEDAPSDKKPAKK